MATWRFLFVSLLLAGIFRTEGQNLTTENSETSPEVTEGAENVVIGSAKQDEQSKKKYKRRVLLIEFINESKSKNTEYLGVSIAEAFSTSLIKTNNFIILNRDFVEYYMKTMNISSDGVHNAENATRLGKAFGADVIVVGKYITKGKSVVIKAKAVDVKVGLVSVEDSEQIRTNASMFNSIDRLATRMSGLMAEKMKPLETPPPPAEVVLTEEEVIAEVKKIEEKKAAEEKRTNRETPRETKLTSHMFLDPGIQLLQQFSNSEKNIRYNGPYPFGSMNPGLAVSLVWQSDFPNWNIFRIVDGFQYGAALSYASHASKLNVLGTKGDLLLANESMKLQIAGIGFFLARNFSIWSFPLIVYAGFNTDYAMFSASKGETLFKGIVPGAAAGARAMLFSFGSFETGIHYRLGFSYLSDGHSYLSHMITVFGGYRL